MIVPASVEAKIRYLLRKFPSTEWSGVLFYNYSGTFEDGNLLITCRDIYPMDLGNSVFTQFAMSNDVAGYMADNIELFDCDLGLVHSHHNMSTFFSGTDTQTLREEGNERNCFVSLIVNNEGTYSAAITRKVVTSKEVTTKDLGSTYNFFGEGSFSAGSGCAAASTTTKEDSVIQYFMLDVQREVVDNPFDSLDKRFEEIEASKRTAKLTATTSSYNKESVPSKWPSKEPSIFESDPAWQLPKQKEYAFNPIEYNINPDVISQAVARMIACSLILNTEKFDLRQWITRHMQKMYDRIFPSDANALVSNLSFQQWCDFVVEYMVMQYVPSQCVLDEWVETEPDSAYDAIAHAMQKELDPYLSYPYIRSYYDALDAYTLDDTPHYNVNSFLS